MSLPLKTRQVKSQTKHIIKLSCFKSLIKPNKTIKFIRPSSCRDLQNHGVMVAD